MAGKQRWMLIIVLISFQVMHGCCDKGTIDEKGKTYCPDLEIGRRIADVSVYPYHFFTASLNHDAFKGADYTVSLSLIVPTPKCWFKFDASTFTLKIMVDRDVIQSQPSSGGGYAFQLTATSSCNQKQLTQTFHVHILEYQKVSCMEIEIELQVNNDKPSACVLTPVNDALTRTRDYMVHSTNSELLSCLPIEYTQLSVGFLRIIVALLVDRETQCKQFCDNGFFQTYASRVVDEFGQINENFGQLLEPDYSAHSAHATIGCTTKTTARPITLHPSPTQHCSPPTTLSGMSDILLNTPYRPSVISIPPNIFSAQQDLILSLHLIPNNGGGQPLCWFYFDSHTIFFFPTNQTILQKSSTGYRFSLTATNKCGLSASVQFTVDITKSIIHPCFLFETVVRHASHLCHERISRDFYEVVRRKVDFSQYGELRLSSVRGLNSQESIISYTVRKQQTIDCSHCSVSLLEDLKSRFSTQNLRNVFKNSQFITHVGESRLAATSNCGGSCGGMQQAKTISLSARAGIINELVLPGTNTNDYSLASAETNAHICIINANDQHNPTTVLFLPPRQIGPHYGIRDHDFQLVKASSECPITLKIHAVPLTETPCYHMILQFYTIQLYPCPLQAVREMVQILAKFYRVRTDQIIIVGYYTVDKSARSTGEGVEISLTFTFTNDVIECSRCSPVLLKNYIAQLVDFKHGGATTDFQQFITGRFHLLNATYLVLTRGRANLAGISDYSDSLVPLWIYMLPLFFILLVLLLLLLSCCICCCSGRKRRRNNSGGGMLASWSKCCLCCCNDSTKSSTSTTKARNVYSASAYPSVHHVSMSSGAGGAAGGAEKNSLTKHRSVDSVNSIYLKGGAGADNINKHVETSAVNIPVAMDAPTHGEQDTKVTYATVIAADKKKTITKTTTVKANVGEDPLYATANLHTKETSQENTTGNRTPGSYIDSQLDQNTSRIRSKRMRSYSDGFLLDDDYLDLPTPPTGISKRRYSKRVSHRYYHDDSVINNSSRSNVSGGKLSRCKITIPVKITARVKNISKSLDDGLDTFRPTYVRFEEPERRKSPDVLVIRSSKDPLKSSTRYRSKRTTYEEEESPIVTRKSRPSYRVLNSDHDDDNDDEYSGRHAKKQSGSRSRVDRFAWDKDSSSYRKTPGKPSKKVETASTAKYFPWETDTKIGATVAEKLSSRKKRTEMTSSKYPWRSNDLYDGTSTTASTNRKYFKVSGNDFSSSEV